MESVPYYVLMAVRNCIAIGALEVYSLTTVLFPAAIAASCALFVPMVLWRRRMVANVTTATPH
jgi:hypothetical protein